MDSFLIRLMNPCKQSKYGSSTIVSNRCGSANAAKVLLASRMFFRSFELPTKETIVKRTSFGKVMLLPWAAILVSRDNTRYMTADKPNTCLGKKKGSHSLG
jgi:hypothetical protein